MRVCARRFGGRLASIHSAGTNAALQLQARLNTKSGFVWIGAVTKPWRRTVQCHWVDRSPWDFHNWQLRHPLCTGRFCTTLCTADGRWRSQGCKVKLPFICEC
ncbi:bone marrow proteoglycan [Apus apus]|uniref:bone marrow proteoglycan n=1 Tax=Apus apus TaxID=8895 RepID=UPI0021F8A508|nr:bone marrow proteoglycan [Apus apus]